MIIRIESLMDILQSVRMVNYSFLIKKKLQNNI